MGLGAQAAGYEGKVKIGMDVAASEFMTEDKKYDLNFKVKDNDKSQILSGCALPRVAPGVCRLHVPPPAGSRRQTNRLSSAGGQLKLCASIAVYLACRVRSVTACMRPDEYWPSVLVRQVVLHPSTAGRAC